MGYVHSIRAPGQNVDMIVGDRVPEIFADGVGDMVFLGTHVKISLFQTRAVNPSDLIAATGLYPERRESALVLTMPVAQFVESFANILVGLAHNFDATSDAQALQRQKTSDLLEILKKTGIAAPQTLQSAADKAAD